MHLAAVKSEADKCSEQAGQPALGTAVELLETLHQDNGELRTSFAEVRQVHAFCTRVYVYARVCARVCACVCVWGV
jgi:hypothetical protein